MPRKPLQTPQEKLLYVASLMGMDNALETLENEVRPCFQKKPNLKVIKNK